MISKSHYMFMTNYSPWPILASVNAFTLMFSLGILLKFGLIYIFMFSLFNISWAAFSWWIFYSNEYNISGSDSFNLDNGLKFAMILFISSEVLFFFSFFWSYFHFFLSPTMETGLIWPPFSLEMFNFMNVPLLNTLILMSSGVTVTISHNLIMEGKKKSFMLFLVSTIFLGFFFSVLQGMEYQSSFFGISDSTFGSSFFMLTGFHGIHVLIGTIFLFLTFMQSLRLATSKKEYLSFELASWYWHFVDVVWIFLYFIIYYLND